MQGSVWDRSREAKAMHIPDGLLEVKVSAATAVIGAAGLAYALRKLEKPGAERTTVLMGTMAAFVFAAQMVNFPVAYGVSGHLLGGVLASVVLGPWAGAVVIASVLLVQCFLFADGGVTALGANFVNMGLIGSVGGYSIYRGILERIKGRKGVLIASMAAAWFSVLLASGAFAVELTASGRGAGFLRVLGWMALVHAVIGLGEAVITGLVVRTLLIRRPDLFGFSAGEEQIATTTETRWVHTMAGGLCVALAVAVFVAPLACGWPDGLEFVGEKLGFLTDATSGSAVRAPMPDYEFTFLGEQPAMVMTALAGVIGTLTVFGLAWGMSRIFPGFRRDEVTAHAA
jgi:cobalt/nickel transport system permease protein